MFDIEAFLTKKRCLYKQEFLYFILLCFVSFLWFKVNQRFAYVLLIQRLFLFLNVLLFFIIQTKAKIRLSFINKTIIFVFKRFIFLSISILLF